MNLTIGLATFVGLFIIAALIFSGSVTHNSNSNESTGSNSDFGSKITLIVVYFSGYIRKVLVFLRSVVEMGRLFVCYFLIFSDTMCDGLFSNAMGSNSEDDFDAKNIRYSTERYCLTMFCTDLSKPITNITAVYITLILCFIATSVVVDDSRYSLHRSNFLRIYPTLSLNNRTNIKVKSQ